MRCQAIDVDSKRKWFQITRLNKTTVTIVAPDGVMYWLIAQQVEEAIKLVKEDADGDEF